MGPSGAAPELGLALGVTKRVCAATDDGRKTKNRTAVKTTAREAKKSFFCISILYPNTNSLGIQNSFPQARNVLQTLVFKANMRFCFVKLDSSDKKQV